MSTAFVPEQLLGRVFTSAQARACGVSDSALRGSSWRQVIHDVWVHADVPDTRELRLAAVRVAIDDRAFLCGPTTAWIYGIDVQDRRAELIWVGIETGRRMRAREGCAVRELTVDAGDLVTEMGTVITTPLRTAFDCARWLSLVEAVVVADHLAHRGLITADGLAAYAATHHGLRGMQQVDRVIELIDARSESPMETRVRLELVFAGMPPEPQFVVENQFGNFVARADFATSKRS
jgi:hypothetical protein